MNDLDYVAPEICDDGQQRAELNDCYECGPFIGPVGIDESHQIACDSEVSGAADRNKLCESLYEPQKYRLPDRH